MSDRQDALMGRYRARSLERLRRLHFWLVSCDDETQRSTLLKDVARELHSLKGDSAVVGAERISEIAHLAEEVLLALGTVPAEFPRASGLVRAALSAIEGALKTDGGQDDALAALGDIGLMMRDAVPSLQDRESAPSALQRGTLAPAASPQPAPATPASASAPRPAPAASEPHARVGPAGSAPDAVRERERWVSVRAGHIDELSDQVMRFVAEFRGLAEDLKRHSAPKDGRETATEMATRLSITDVTQRCITRLDDLATAVWSLRLVPVEPLLQELVPHVKDLAAAQSKRVRVVIHGQGAEVERSTLEELREPLLHLVRNAVVHGIEPVAQRGSKPAEGLISLDARQSGGSVVLSVSDDGRGVDLPAVREQAVAQLGMSPEAAEKLSDADATQLLFVPGFSTRKSTDTSAGRGVGLDVVRERLDALGGRVTLSSTTGAGTHFEISVPATIGKERAFVVACGRTLYALPSFHTLDVVLLRDYPKEQSGGREFIRHRGELVPIQRLAEAFREPSASDSHLAAIVQGTTQRRAFILPELVGEFDLLRRPIDPLVSRFGHIAASATLDDGRLVLLLSVDGLLRVADLGLSARSVAAPRIRSRRRVLIVDDSATVVDVVREILANAGYETAIASHGQEALASIEANTPDLVLSDVEMPIMGGFELLERIRARWPRLPVIMLTTRGGSDDRRRALSLGANAYLVKSTFEQTLLIEAVQRFVSAQS